MSSNVFLKDRVMPHIEGTPDRPKGVRELSNVKRPAQEASTYDGHQNGVPSNTWKEISKRGTSGIYYFLSMCVFITVGCCVPLDRQ